MWESLSKVKRSKVTVAAIGVFVAIAVFAVFSFLPAPPAQAACCKFSLTIHLRTDQGTSVVSEAKDRIAPNTESEAKDRIAAETETDSKTQTGAKTQTDTKSKTQVLKIVSGRDTINLGEKAVPLGGVKEKSEATEEESRAGNEPKHERGLDFKIEKHKPNDINITIGNDRNYGDGKDIVRFGEDVVVAETDTIDGDVVSIGGSVTVNGTVKGDCVSIGGYINVGPHGVIEGDGVSIGGSINREPGSVLKGDEVVTGGNIPKWIFRGGWPQYGLSGLKFLGFAFAVGKALVILFLVWLVVLIFRDRVKVTSDRARANLLALSGSASSQLY